MKNLNAIKWVQFYFTRTSVYSGTILKEDATDLFGAFLSFFFFSCLFIILCSGDKIREEITLTLYQYIDYTAHNQNENYIVKLLLWLNWQISWTQQSLKVENIPNGYEKRGWKRPSLSGVLSCTQLWELKKSALRFSKTRINCISFWSQNWKRMGSFTKISVKLRNWDPFSVSLIVKAVKPKLKC